jgi:hypothetical protein
VNPSNFNSVPKIHISQILARFGSNEPLKILLPSGHNICLNVTAFPPSNRMCLTRSCTFPATCTSQNLAAPGPLTLLKIPNLRTKLNCQEFPDFTPQESCYISPSHKGHILKILSHDQVMYLSESCYNLTEYISRILYPWDTYLSRPAVFPPTSCWIRATCVQLICILFVSSS